jgi:hypothetical protein
METKTCNKCHKEKPLSDFNKQGYYCKDCRTTYMKEYRQKIKENDPLTYRLTVLAAAIMARTKHRLHKKQNKIYRERGTKCFLGDTEKQVSETLRKHFAKEIIELIEAGKTPSVDRIDPNGHYEIGNIQIVPLEENLKRAEKARLKAVRKKVKVTFPSGEFKVYPSISHASKELGTDRKSIGIWAQQGTPNRRGLLFELV